MAERKKRGLGRGLGALIPDANSSDRPVDVFFSGGNSEESDRGSERETATPRTARTDPAASMQSSRRRKAKPATAAKSGESKTTGAKSGATKSGASKSGESKAGTVDGGTSRKAAAKTTGSTGTGSKSTGSTSETPKTGTAKTTGSKNAPARSTTTKAGAAKAGSAETTSSKSTTAKADGSQSSRARSTPENVATTEAASKSSAAASNTSAVGAKDTSSDSDASVARSQTSKVDSDPSDDVVTETHPGVYTSSGYSADKQEGVVEDDVDDPLTTNVVTNAESADDSESTTEGPVTDEVHDEAESAESSADQPDEGLSGVESIPDTEFGEIDVDLIDANPRQPRTVFDEDMLAELVHSIREIGVLQPVVVRQKPSDRSRFELIMGERRLRATKDAGLATIPAIIRYVEDTDLLRDALLENLHRAELNPLEEAAAYGQLLEDFGCTQEELSERIGRSRPQISNTLRLLRLPPLVQRRVAAGVISAGHARAILGLRDPEHMEILAQRIVAEGLSVRASEEAVVLLNRGDSINVSRATSKVSPEFIAVAQRLGDQLDTKVNISVGKRKGKLSVEFANQEDLDRILNLLGVQQESSF